jgi:hypothetical protein
MNSNVVLDTLWENYLVAEDCLRIAQRSVKNNDISSIQGTDFMETPRDKAFLKIEKCRKNTDDYFVLAFWASFERCLFDYIQAQGRIIFGTQPSVFNEKFHQKIETQMEYWKSNEVLDLFKAIIDPNLIGQAKQVKQYRDWVAHRNPNKPLPVNVTPQIAYDILSIIAKQLDQHNFTSTTNISFDINHEG